MGVTSLPPAVLRQLQSLEYLYVAAAARVTRPMWPLTTLPTGALRRAAVGSDLQSCGLDHLAPAQFTNLKKLQQL